MEQATAQGNMKLIIEDDEGRRSVVPIDLGEATVGRDEHNTIRLNERNVSRRHARLVRENGTIVAEDLDSYNGVFVNGDRVKNRQDIHEGDILRVGGFQLELRGEGMSRRSEETTQRAGPPGSFAEVTKPSIRLDEPGDGVLHDPADYDDAAEDDQRHEPTAIIRVDQMEERPDRRDPRALSGARARLICVSTQFAGKEFEIERDEAVIGRTTDNDIAVDHRSVSRHHAKILFSGSSYRIIDMKSANGTLVNGEEYAQIELKSGDLIELGHVRFRFVPPGERYAYQPDELAAISKGAAGSRASAPAPEPVSEYEPPRETTNPGLGADVARALPEGGVSNTWLYVGLGVVVVLLAAVLAVLLIPGDAPEPVVRDAPTAGARASGVDDLVVRMSDAMLEKDWRGASEAADTILLLAPGHPRATKIQGLAKMELRAAEAFEQAIELSNEEDWGGVVESLGTIPAESSLAAQAAKMRASAEQKIEIGDRIEDAARAIEEKRWDDAEALSSDLADLDPEASKALLDQIEAGRRSDKTPRSSTTRRVVPPKPVPKPVAKTPKPTPKADPAAVASKTKSYLREAVVLIKAGKYEDALEPLQACVRENARNCRCYRTLGIAHAKLSNSAKARRYYKSYIELCPDADDAAQVRAYLGE